MISEDARTSLLKLLKRDRCDRLMRLFKGRLETQEVRPSGLFMYDLDEDPDLIERCYAPESPVHVSPWHKEVNWFDEFRGHRVLMGFNDPHRLGRWSVPPPNWSEWRMLDVPAYNSFAPTPRVMSAMWLELYNRSWRASYTPLRAKRSVADELSKVGIDCELLVFPSTEVRSAERMDLQSWVASVTFPSDTFDLRAIEDLDALVSILEEVESKTGQAEAKGFDDPTIVIEDYIKQLQSQDPKFAKALYGMLRKLRASESVSAGSDES